MGTMQQQSASAAVFLITTSHLSGSTDKKAKQKNIQDAVDCGNVGVSPLKNSPPSKIPAHLTTALETNSTIL